LTDEEWKDIVAWLQRKPSAEEVEANIRKLEKGGKQMTEVTNYFFKDLMQKVRNGQDAFTIADSFVHKPIIEYFAAKIDVNEKVFPKRYPMGQLVESAMRLCGIRCCRNPSQFPLKTCHAILDEYLPDGGNWYDPCMGWGTRMVAAWQRKNVTYYGTDTNEELYNRLCELAYKLNDNHDFLFDIRQFSAAEHQIGWNEMMDLCFTSPPYFNLEYYEGENTSATPETTYEQWKDGFLKPVFNNCYAYLKDGGVMAWNIKDVYTNKKWWPLVKDSIEAAEEAGFKYEGDRTLKNIKRMYGSRGDSGKKGFNPNADERILIFRK
jgi:DNA modification methylase